MAKKNVQPASEEVEVIAPEKEESTKAEKKSANKKSKATEKQELSAKDSKNSKDKKAKDKAKSKDKKEKKSLKKKTAEVLSEFKKVSKPSFGKVVKNTCVVIGVVAICTVLLFGVDKLFSLLYNLLLP